MTKQKRSEFPKSVRVAAWARSGGKCEECTKKLFPGKFVYDHIVPDGLGGKPTLENCRVLCANEQSSCNHKKTYGLKHSRLDGDLPKMAKVRRITAKGGLMNAKPTKPGRKLQSRGFTKGPFKKMVDGSVVRRDAS